MSLRRFDYCAKVLFIVFYEQEEQSHHTFLPLYILMSGTDIGLYGILTKAILLTTDTVSMLVVAHIRTRLKPFGGNYCKRAINGIYNWVSRKHMQRYFDEFCFRYNTRNVSINERFAEAILHCKSRLTYNKLTA
mgnify:CR=1